MEVRILILWTLASVWMCQGYPDFSGDYVVSEADLEPLYRDYVNKQREMNEGIPNPCKNNLCDPMVEEDVRKGSFHWPSIMTGQQVSLRCPFSFTSAVYTPQTCTVDSQGRAVWNGSRHAEICPDPPLAQVLETLRHQFQYAVSENVTIFLVNLVDQVSEVFHIYRDAPVDEDDIRQLLILTTQPFSQLNVTDKHLDQQTVVKFFSVMDTLMDDDLIANFRLVSGKYSFGERLRQILITLLFMTDTKNLMMDDLNHIVVQTTKINTLEEAYTEINGGTNATRLNPKWLPGIELELKEDNKSVSVPLILIVLQYSDIFITENIWLTTTIFYENATFFFENGTFYNWTMQAYETSQRISDYESLGSTFLLYTIPHERPAVMDIQVSYKIYTSRARQVETSGNTQRGGSVAPSRPVGPPSDPVDPSDDSLGQPSRGPVDPSTPVGRPSDPVDYSGLFGPSDDSVGHPIDSNDPSNPIGPPTDQIDPSNPIGPPTDPIDPSNPIGPPSNPSNPIGPPIDPIDPSNPIGPPSDPIDPSNPIGPLSNPDDLHVNDSVHRSRRKAGPPSNSDGLSVSTVSSYGATVPGEQEYSHSNYSLNSSSSFSVNSFPSTLTATQSTSDYNFQNNLTISSHDLTDRPFTSSFTDEINSPDDSSTDQSKLHSTADFSSVPVETVSTRIDHPIGPTVQTPADDVRRRTHSHTKTTPITPNSARPDGGAPGQFKCTKVVGQGVWSNRDCTTVIQTDEDGFTHCVCTGLGTFSVFSQQTSGPRGPPAPTFPPEMIEPTIIEGDISAFLGFPYRKELELAGSVLGSISLACLLLTIASYTLFSGARTGIPTIILLNLCFALVVLSVLLLMVQYVDAIKTTTGCTVANVLRYYVVFVTLMWNSVEAFNMYLMLVKVFNSNVKHFALKAGIIAWGIPLVMVAICFAVNKKAFNGRYVNTQNIKGKCQFKCQLSDNMLYYAYIIPMAVLILQNFIIFATVFRTILKHGEKLGKSKRRSHIVKLIGAVATLVLLGVPWIFSAFGAIDATSNDQLAVIEGTFQVVFVVFVNLQGMFIFIFHCARNVKVRDSWSSAVRSVVTTRSNSYVS